MAIVLADISNLNISKDEVMSKTILNKILGTLQYKLSMLRYEKCLKTLLRESGSKSQSKVKLS